MESISSLSEKSGILENEWYMNKLDKLGVEKVLNQENGRPTLKIKKLEEVFVCIEELSDEEVEDLDEDRIEELSDEEVEDLDEDMEIESMTLKEIQHYFKKSSKEASGNNKMKSTSNIMCDLPCLQNMQEAQFFDCLSMDSFELQARKIASINEANVEHDCSDLPGKEKTSLISSLDVAGPLQVEESEDDWTLEMGRSYNKHKSAFHGALNFTNPPSKSADGLKENTSFHSATERDLKSSSKFVLPLCQLNAPSVNYEVLEDLKDDESFFDSISSAEISYKTCRTVDPLVKPDLKNSLQHGVSTISSQKKSVLGESAIATWSGSQLKPCLTTNIATLGIADMTCAADESPHFELRDHGNVSQAGATDCKPHSSSCSLQAGASTLSSFQSGVILLDLDNEMKKPTTMNILACASKHDNSTKDFDNYGDYKNVNVKETADAVEMASELLIGCKNQTTMPVTEPIPDTTTVYFGNDESISMLHYQDLLLPTDVKLVPSLDKSNSSMKDKEHRKVVSECTKPSKDRAFSIPPCLLSSEILDVEEKKDSELYKPPTKIPCKRKAISPLSQEKLLQAMTSNDSSDWAMQDSEALAVHKGLKKPAEKSNKFHDETNQEWVECSRRKIQRGPSSSPDQLDDVSHGGSPPFQKSEFQSLHIKSRHLSTLSRIGAMRGLSHKASPVVDQKSPSPLQKASKDVLESRKGILKNRSRTCRGACKCEECKSLRFRVGKASEFSQRQMRDIEALANKLVKELNTMRSIVEENILSESKSTGIEPRISLQQVKEATNSAAVAEEMTKKWLLIMARDCSRYCKIMRMQQRKLTFADEAGGQLCEVKLFHSQNNSRSQFIGTQETKLFDDFHGN